jgi:hypothetical protein
MPLRFAFRRKRANTARVIPRNNNLDPDSMQTTSPIDFNFVGYAEGRTAVGCVRAR